jgi:hypothetical protein
MICDDDYEISGCENAHTYVVRLVALDFSCEREPKGNLLVAEQLVHFIAVFLRDD